MVRSIFCVATSLPSTLSTPVPPRPMPLMLLKASVPMPRPSYLKSNSSVCLPGDSASAPSQRTRFRSTRFQSEHRLALQHVEAVAAEAAALGDEHAFAAALRDFDLGLEVVRGIEDARRVAVGRAGERAGVGEHVAAGGDAGPRRDEPRRHRRIERQHLVLLGLLPRRASPSPSPSPGTWRRRCRTASSPCVRS